MRAPFTALLRACVLLGVLLLGVWPVAADRPTDGRAGRAELRFLEGMIDHHQMALDMAADCLEKAAPLATLCQRIIDAQSAEIAQMQAWLLAWYGVTYTPMSLFEMDMMHSATPGAPAQQGGHAGHGGHSAATPEAIITDPPMMMGMFAGFNRLEGADYEAAWLESMIDHHDDALHMAERLLQRVGADGHAELRALAELIIADQTAEIAEMEALLAGYAA